MLPTGSQSQTPTLASYKRGFSKRVTDPIYSKYASINFKFAIYLGTQTRGNKYKTFPDHVSYNLCNYFSLIGLSKRGYT